MPITWTRFEQDIDLIVDGMYKILSDQINGITDVQQKTVSPKFIMGDSL
ncbi:MAG: hypothetical protein KBT47_04865 [Armatimonadetes bacterium]|nr:hypothetical protein [Candidatus Hippobium faecium]